MSSTFKSSAPHAVLTLDAVASSPTRWPRRERRLVAALLLADLLVIGVSVVVALQARVTLGFFADAPDVVALVTPLAAALVPAWLASLALLGAYDTAHLGAGMTEYRRVYRGSFALAAALGISAYLAQYPLSRGFFFLLFAVGIPTLLLERGITRRLLHRARTAGRLTTPALIGGDLDHLDDIADVLHRERWLGYRLIGALTSDHDAPSETRHGVPVLGTPDDAAVVAARTGARAVIFAEGSFRRGRDFNAVARDFEHTGTRLIMVPSLTDVSAQRLEIRPVAGIPLVHIDRPRAQAAAHWRKRVFDIVGSALLLVVGSPILLAVALAIKISDGGPILFAQQRAGIKGEPFRFFKFRSMVVDAEARLAELAAQNESDGVLFKMSDDPRITLVGRFIRRYSLDELPQLVNVLRGDMSLIGPRPALLHEVSRYETHVLRRLDVRPGMTGLWQVSGRSDLSWDETVRLDLYYVDNWSMIQDLTILARTLGAVVGRHGAY